MIQILFLGRWNGYFKNDGTKIKSYGSTGRKGLVVNSVRCPGPSSSPYL